MRAREGLFYRVSTTNVLNVCRRRLTAYIREYM